MSTEENNEMVFGKTNYMFLIGGAVTLLIGFILMSGGGSSDPNVFNPEIFSAQRISVAPIVILVGFAIVMVGIFKKNTPEK
ncbi:MAG: DUF3098 domain-containing protein [Flavobacteriales bacterium]|tara:strand:- start:235 stop:477 length:243 start_codon:yes stop_codon:yes gene_type:complete